MKNKSKTRVINYLASQNMNSKPNIRFLNWNVLQKPCFEKIRERVYSEPTDM